MTHVTVFAPSPILTVTVEDHPSGTEIHIHAGGQGVWQARMLRRLGVSVTMCCVLSGEGGRMLRHLLEDEGLTVVAIERDGRAAAYLHDRRDGDRVVVADEAGDPIGRHDLDELYGVVLKDGIEAGLVILSGPADDAVLPADTYRRLAADLRESGARVLADLAGERRAAAVEGGVDVLKISHEELRDDGLIGEDSTTAIMAAMRALRAQGVGTVIVTRAEAPLLLLDEQGFLEVAPPQLEVADTRGAGDSLTAGVAAAMANGESPRSAITLGAAAGALNVTRHGLGTGDAEAIARLRTTVRADEVREETIADDDTFAGRVSPDGLAALADTEDVPDDAPSGRREST